MWDPIVSVPDHCFSFYLVFQIAYKYLLDTTILSEHIGLVSPFSPSCPPLTFLCSTHYSRILMSAPGPRQTQHLRFETSFRPEDHTDWERAPLNYDLQSWSSLGLNEHLRILYPDEPP